MARRSAGPTRSLDALLAAKEIVVTCGSGGVGKTTTAAAAAAMAAAHHGGRVLVLTVDPARRLANALGLEAFGNVERRVEDAAFEAAGIAPRGELWVAMLDTKASWDDLVRRHAPDEATRDAILANPLYENITTRFVHSHDYIAMERLYDIHSTGTYDLLVVDTPPSRNALDFLDAPKRMAEFFNSRLLRWLTVPYRSRVMTAASRPFYQLADRILGSQFLQDIAEFFILFQTMHDGFVERARSVQRLLADSRTTFVVVTTLEPSPLHEAEFFVDALHDRKLNLGAVVLNKVLPDYLRDPEVALAATSMASTAEALGKTLAPVVSSTPVDVARLLRDVAASFHDYALAATRQAEQRGELSSVPEALVPVPQLGSDLTDLASVLELGRYLWGQGPESASR